MYKHISEYIICLTYDTYVCNVYIFYPNSYEKFKTYDRFLSIVTIINK